MMSNIYTDKTKRHDFVFLIDVKDGNPNGDPDAGNQPRMDPITMQGLMSDVCIKRKIRDYVDLTRGSEAKYKIYVQNKGIALNDLHMRAYTTLGITSVGKTQDRQEVEQVRAWMCENFYDIRAMGAVMALKVNCGQVRGPIQVTFARSIDPIIPMDMAITRVAIAEPGTSKQTMIGRKSIVPYALYMGYGFYVPSFAKSTGFTQEDLKVFWEAFVNAWDLDRSAMRGMLALRGLYIFSHDNPLGNAPAHRLFERVQAEKLPEVKVSRRLQDYMVTVDETNLPAGVTLTPLVDIREGMKLVSHV
jgi:CRISPR-associated protein Csd2